MIKVKTLETKRLLLKPTDVEDSSFIFELVNMPKWSEFIGDRCVNSIDDANLYIVEKIRPQIEKIGYGNYTVILKSEGHKIGTCGLYDREGLEGVDIGFAFLPEYEGQGYAFEGSQKLLEVGFTNLAIEKVNAITLPSNIASQKLLEKLGLRFVKRVKLPHDDNELMLYQVTVSN